MYYSLNTHAQLQSIIHYTAIKFEQMQSIMYYQLISHELKYHFM